MVLIQLLLPLPTTSAAPDSLPPIAQTRNELAERFTGLTAYVRSPAKGVWTSPEGHVEQDDVVMVEIVADTFDRGWWRGYTATLQKRFAQDAIHLRALRIEMLDEGAA